MLDQTVDQIRTRTSLEAGVGVVLAHMGSYQHVRVTRIVPEHCRLRGARGMEAGDDVVLETVDGRFVQGEVVWSYLGETCIRLQGELGIALPA